MKKLAVIGCLLMLTGFGLGLGLKHFNGEWSGVDETVVEKFAEQANRPAHEPLINTDQGDLLLFLFLLAGAAGGFAGGYYFRELFPPKTKSAVHASRI